MTACLNSLSDLLHQREEGGCPEEEATAMMTMLGDASAFWGVATSPLLDPKGKQGEVAAVLPTMASSMQTSLESSLESPLKGCPEGPPESPLLSPQLSPSIIHPTRPKWWRRHNGGSPEWCWLVWCCCQALCPAECCSDWARQAASRQRALCWPAPTGHKTQDWTFHPRRGRRQWCAKW